MRQRLYDRMERWWDSLPPERQAIHYFWLPRVAMLIMFAAMLGFGLGAIWLVSHVF